MAADTNHEMSVRGPCRHPDLWFEDGNIVLQAEDTVFKVFRSILSKHAQLFRDIFSLPRSTTETEQEQYEESVLIRVQEEAEHMAIFLRAIFDPTYVLCQQFCERS